jgi:hypothetical protein
MSEKQQQVKKLRAVPRRRRRKRGEVMIARQSIRWFCVQCMGYQPSEVTVCTAPDCPLYPWRMGMTPEAAAKRGYDVL